MFWKRKQAAVVGIGLMGGSLAAALRERGWKVRGFDRDREAVNLALAAGIIDTGCRELAEAVGDADLVCLAVPPGEFTTVLGRCVPFLQPDCVVTDVASVKAGPTQAAAEILPPGIHFVGGHPMTGSEQWGVRASSSRLLVGAPYILTPTDATQPRALAALEDLVRSLGARPVIMDPADHDYWVALVSHLPHIVASALSNLGGRLDRDGERVASIAAGSFRDTTRVASANPALWRDICLNNRERLKELLAMLQDILTEFAGGMAAADEVSIMDFFAGGKKYRDSLVEKWKQGGGREGNGSAYPADPGPAGDCTGAGG